MECWSKSTANNRKSKNPKNPAKNQIEPIKKLTIFARSQDIHKIKHNSEIKKFIQENSSLFWWIKPEEKMNISINAIVEAVLNYGNGKSVKRLFDLVGIETVAGIFYQQISGKRSNYHQRTKHFFQIYFKRHAQ